MRHLFIILFLICSTSFGQVYVDAAFVGSETGSQTNPYNTIQEGLNAATTGQTVYVKAGSYGAEYLTTQATNVTIEGYTTTTGDIVASEGPTYTYADFTSDSQVLPSNIMPLLTATASNNIPGSSEVGLTINHSGITVKNLMFTKHYAAIRINQQNATIDNVIGFKFGNWNSSNPCWNTASVTCSDFQTGNGIWSPLANAADGTTVTNSMIIDAGLASYFFAGDDNITMSFCEAYIANGGNSSDYMFDVYQTTNSLFEDCYAERENVGETAHRSRIMTLQVESDSNTVRRLRGIGSKFQIEASNDNYIEDLYIESLVYESTGGIQIMSNSQTNVFKNVYLKGEGIQFLTPDNSSESTRDDSPTSTAGENNYFVNVIMEQMFNQPRGSVIDFDRLGRNNTKEAGTHYLINATINGAPRIINANRVGTIYFYNVTFNDITVEEDGFMAGYPDETNNYTAYYRNCHFFNTNGFTLPTPPNGTVSDSFFGTSPEFIVGAGEDYTIPLGSALIDVGFNTANVTPYATTDYTGALRGTPYDIGAFEGGTIIGDPNTGDPDSAKITGTVGSGQAVNALIINN